MLFSQNSLGYAAKIEKVNMAISSSVSTSFSWEFIHHPQWNTSRSTSALDKKDPPDPCGALNRGWLPNISWLFFYVLPSDEQEYRDDLYTNHR